MRLPMQLRHELGCSTADRSCACPHKSAAAVRHMPDATAERRLCERKFASGNTPTRCIPATAAERNCPNALGSGAAAVSEW